MHGPILSMDVRMAIVISPTSCRLPCPFPSSSAAFRCASSCRFAVRAPRHCISHAAALQVEPSLHLALVCAYCLRLSRVKRTSQSLHLPLVLSSYHQWLVAFSCFCWPSAKKYAAAASRCVPGHVQPSATGVWPSGIGLHSHGFQLHRRCCARQWSMVTPSWWTCSSTCRAKQAILVGDFTDASSWVSCTVSSDGPVAPGASMTGIRVTMQFEEFLVRTSVTAILTAMATRHFIICAVVHTLTTILY
mmetsp:Transcript_71232/g.130390  ORF Transcript_71232/g.130390 Transcript_71232/m.130390 type:complete len:247 (+) Transcript_71232:203-943(+)